MSGYWDALVGAALGRPGTARPLDPPLFSGDEGAGLVEAEERVEAPPPIAAQAAAPVPARARPSAAGEAEAADRGERPGVPPARTGSEAFEQALPPPVAHAPAQAAPPPLPAPPAERLERLIVVEERPAEVAGPDAARPAQPAPVAASAVEAAGPGDALPLPPEAPPVAAPAPPRPAAPDLEPPRPEILLVAAEPVPAPPVPVEPPPRDAGPEPLTIEIGRIDVRIVAPAPPPAAEPARRTLPDGVPLLADYLARRGEGGR